LLIDTIKIEAHYSAVLAERCKIIVGMFDQIQALQQRITELEQQVAKANGDATAPAQD